MASPPRRRSSRLRTPARTLQNNTNTHLTSLVEDDEAATYPSLPNVSSPVEPPQTPATAGRVIPPREEMHPSMTHKSTTQKPDSGLRHGFVDINAKGDDQPSGVQQKTPSKIGISSPTFDFKFARPAPVLGPEAQRMMDDLREEALRIKAKLAAEREMEQKNNPEGSNIGGRKIAQAKGKVSRYSDVHMAEFKKMDSIANHPSSFRAQPGRITPNATSLKRTQSKAKLSDRDATHSEESSQDAENERLENSAPAKRARQRKADDASSLRPVSRGKTETIPMPSTPRHQISGIPAHLTTPTQASLARARSVKHPATQIPSFSRSPSKPNLQSTPQGMTKSATMNNIAGSMTAPSKSMLRTPSRFDRVKSILKHPGSSFRAKKAENTSAIPSIARSASKPNLARDLPSVPTTPIGIGRSKSMKQVGFTPETRKHNEAKHNETTVPQSPSPVKSGIPRSTSKPNIKISSSIAPRRPVPQQGHSEQQATNAEMSGTNRVEYPSLAGVRPLPEPPRQAPPHLPASIPGTFTFRSDHTISFGASPKGFGPSPSQASVRQVRRSIFPDTMPGSFPDGNKENSGPPVRESSKKPTNLGAIPTVPHGMSNKKRRRVESDGEEEARSPKKQKAPEGAMLMAPDLQAGKNVAAPNSTSSPAKKRGLTLSRLNMLARPKSRK